MPSSPRAYLPLLHVLRKLPPVERQIIVSHLNDHSCEYIEVCIEKVLKSKKRVSPEVREALEKCIREHKTDVSRLFSTRSPNVKRKTLAKVGGGFLSLLLGVGVPLLLSLLKKKK